MGISAVIGAVGGVVGLSAGVLGLVNPLQRTVFYKLNEAIPNQELDIDTAIEAYFRGVLSKNDVYSIARKHGFAKEKVDQLIETRWRLLSLEDYINMFFRGAISEEELVNRFAEYGIRPEQIKPKIEIHKRIYSISEAFFLYRLGKISKDDVLRILKANGVDEDKFSDYELLTSYLPSPSDIIRFAVREVFTPEVVEKFKMYEDLPEQYLEMARKLGIPEEYAKWYWYAHWELPSLTMGFEMFHRKIISRDELLLLMRTLDIMPFWRDKLIELSYNLPTRVDVRRMYEIGVITYDQLIEYYEKMGYSPEDARRLAEWTAIEYVFYERDLTVKQVIELYQLGEFTREEAKNYLVKLRYSPEVAEYKLTLAEHEQVLKEAKEYMQLLKDEFVKGLMTYEQFYDEMFKLPFSPTTIKREIYKALKEKEKQTRLPTKAELKKWLKLGIITIDEFKNYLKLMNYRDEDIDKYIKEIEILKSIEEIVAGSEEAT